MRTVTVALLCLLCVLPVHSQDVSDKHSPFGCSQQAVEVDVSNKPSLRITPVRGLPCPSVMSGPPFAFRRWDPTL